MDEEEARDWIQKYQIEIARERVQRIPTYQTNMEIPDEPLLKTREDYRQVGDAYIWFGEIFTAQGVYENHVGEGMPAKKLLDATERMRDEMALKIALRCYMFAVDTIQADHVKQARRGLLYLKDRYVFAGAGTDHAVDTINALLELLDKI